MLTRTAHTQTLSPINCILFQCYGVVKAPRIFCRSSRAVSMNARVCHMCASKYACTKYTCRHACRQASMYGRAAFVYPLRSCSEATTAYQPLPPGRKHVYTSSIDASPGRQIYSHMMFGMSWRLCIQNEDTSSVLPRPANIRASLVLPTALTAYPPRYSRTQAVCKFPWGPLVGKCRSGFGFF